AHRRGACAAANRRVVHHHEAGAARLHHAGDASAARLDHVATLLIAARATDTDAGISHFALAHSHRQVERAHRHAFHHDAATAHAAGEHGAKVLHHAASHLVVAGTSDFHSTGTLLELEVSARNHEVIADRRGGRSAHGRRPHPHGWNAHARHT